MKYSAQHHAIKLLIEETKLGLQTIVEEEANAAQAGGSV